MHNVRYELRMISNEFSTPLPAKTTALYHAGTFLIEPSCKALDLTKVRQRGRSTDCHCWVLQQRNHLNTLVAR